MRRRRSYTADAIFFNAETRGGRRRLEWPRREAYDGAAAASRSLHLASDKEIAIRGLFCASTTISGQPMSLRNSIGNERRARSLR
jgi:hypothetical protein